MKITPDTTITLYSGVDIGTEQQLAFSNITKQTDYFATKQKGSPITGCTVVKDKIGVIKVPIKPRGHATTGEITGEDLATCNYMSFINKTFDNKTIYCYIIDYSYDNNECAYIQYAIDYWQTWCFDVTFLNSFIDREHLSQDEWTKVDTNPYRMDVPQMLTAEPLPVPVGYEKPFYDIEYWNYSGNYDNRDGQALLNCQKQKWGASAGSVVKDMLEGGWDYWNIMLILAPTDWSAFAPSDVTYFMGDIVYYNGSYYECQVPSTLSLTDSSTFNPSDWGTALTVFNTNKGTSPITGGIALGAYVLDQYGGMWTPRNITYITETFDPTNVNTAAFRQVDYRVFGECKVADEYNEIINTYGIVVTPAGSLTTNYNYGGVTNYSWSCKPKGCDILYINKSEAWKALASFLTRYYAVSQILGIYAVPQCIVNLAHLDQATTTPHLNTLASSDNVLTNVSSARTSLNTSGKQKAVRNKKLYTSPFSYLRILSPDGNIKEYKYEYFTDVAEGNTTDIKFKIIASVDGDVPAVYLIPWRYKTKYSIPSDVISDLNNLDETVAKNLGTVWDEAVDFNLDEAIMVTGFPEVSFNTDGYLTFLAGQYSSLLAEYNTNTQLALNVEGYNTDMTKNTIQNTTNWASNIFSNTASGAMTGGKVGGGSGAVIGGLIGTANGVGTGGANWWFAQESANWNRTLYENQAMKYDEAQRWGNGTLLSSDNAYVDRFAACKPAYANSVYVGGTGGVIRYLRGIGLFDFIAIHVQLREEILDYYDTWFDMYGYTSGRCGIPHVVDFVQGETGATKVPHWSTVNGKPTTYVKTYDAKVEHSMLPVARAITAMFNEGVRFQKGDLS